MDVKLIGSNKPAIANDLTTIQQAVIPAEILDLVERAKGYADKAKSDGTHRAYASDWNDFADWCEAQGVDALPALPAAIGLYLKDRADTLKPPAWIRRSSPATASARGSSPPRPGGGASETAIMRQTGRSPRADMHRLPVESFRFALGLRCRLAS